MGKSDEEHHCATLLVVDEVEAIDQCAHELPTPHLLGLQIGRRPIRRDCIRLRGGFAKGRLDSNLQVSVGNTAAHLDSMSRTPHQPPTHHVVAGLGYSQANVVKALTQRQPSRGHRPGHHHAGDRDDIGVRR